jgi:hypothetical protein
MDARLRSKCQAVGRLNGIGGRTAVQQYSGGSSDRKGQGGGVFGRAQPRSRDTGRVGGSGSEARVRVPVRN